MERLNADDIEAIPRSLKVGMAFIDRVGFPIFAFITLAAFCFYVAIQLTAAINRNTETLATLKTYIETKIK